MFTADLTELPKWRTLGSSFFLLQSEHAFMRQGAGQLAAKVRDLT